MNAYALPIQILMFAAITAGAHPAEVAPKTAEPSPVAENTLSGRAVNSIATRLAQDLVAKERKSLLSLDPSHYLDPVGSAIALHRSGKQRSEAKLMATRSAEREAKAEDADEGNRKAVEDRSSVEKT